jgi:hypothetical protein
LTRRDAISTLVITVLAAVAEVERALIIERTVLGTLVLGAAIFVLSMGRAGG